MKVVVAGTNIRNVAESAKKAGWRVFAVTKHCDADLYLYADEVVYVSGKNVAKETVRRIAESHNAHVVLSTGFEDLKVDNTLGRADRDVLDKKRFYRVLERAGVPVPGKGSPWIVKPRRGGGGTGVFLSEEPVNSKEFVCQRYINGVLCSASLLCGREIEVVTLNHLLSGWKEMNAPDFVYSGNITPFICDPDIKKEICKIAVETAELFDLQGSVGVDFVIADKPYVLELNPRFQGSLDSVEWSLDVNLFSLHVASCEGKSVHIPKPRRTAGRAILFADRELKLNIPPTHPFFADIPAGNTEKGEPVLSILASGNNIISKILVRKRLVYEMQL